MNGQSGNQLNDLASSHPRGGNTANVIDITVIIGNLYIILLWR